jgi:hypothetical protein
MRMKIQAVEDTQLPRWVYAMMKAKEGDDTELDDSGDIRKRVQAQLAATDFYKLRQARLKEMADAQGTSSRYTGQEWRYKKPNKFTAEELDKIIPTRRASFVITRAIRLTIVGSLVGLFTAFIAFIGMSVCAELKLTSTNGQNITLPMLENMVMSAWSMATTDPIAYYHRVMNALGS